LLQDGDAVPHHVWQRSPRSCWFSTSTSSSPPSVEVTVTTSNVVETDNMPSPDLDSRGENDAGDNDRDPRLSIPTRPGSQPPTGRPKSANQIAEEEILSLQSEVRSHHRHAAYGTALESASKLLDLASSHFGPLHPATASAHNNVGLMNKLLGNYDEAREAYHESLRVYGEVCGKDHASYAAALSNLGMLERGRVLESEAAEGEEVDDDNTAGGESSSGISNEDEVDLEQLRNDNVASKSSKHMSALERMQLNESAIEYFDEAHRIRLSELGPDHPHTVASRSQLGSAMAAAVIAERRGRIGGLVETELRRLKHQRDVKDSKEMEAHVPEAVARAAAKSGKTGSRLTSRRWEAAEEHLRGALSTAVASPRGDNVAPLAFIVVGSLNSSIANAEDVEGGNREGRGLTLPPKKDRSLSKKDRKRMEKERKREKRQANASANSESMVSNTVNKMKGGKISIQGAAGKVATLSAATAAQNLAVFLKNYSDWMRLTSLDDSQTSSNTQQPQIKKLKQTIQEARHLYEAALHVRSLMLAPHHPDVVASKFSLAELLDSPGAIPFATLGGEEEVKDTLDGRRANVLREEILNAYDVQEREEGSGGSNYIADSK